MSFTSKTTTFLTGRSMPRKRVPAGSEPFTIEELWAILGENTGRPARPVPNEVRRAFLWNEIRRGEFEPDERRLAGFSLRSRAALPDC